MRSRQELRTTQVEQDRTPAQQIRELVQFMRDYQAGRTDFDKLRTENPVREREFRAKLAELHGRYKADPSFKERGLSVAGMAEEIATELERRAQPEPTIPMTPMSEFRGVTTEVRDVEDVVRLKGGRGEWQIVGIDSDRQTYIIASPMDRRSNAEIIQDVKQGRRMNGQPVGYEMRWDDLEELAA